MTHATIHWELAKVVRALAKAETHLALAAVHLRRWAEIWERP